MAEKKKYRVAITGTGKFAYTHLQAIEEFNQQQSTITGRGKKAVLELIAACDTDKERLEKFAVQAGIPLGGRYGDASLMMGRGDIDIGIVVTPPEYTAENTMLFLDAGAHVLLEKPIALSASAAKGLVTALHESKYQELVTMVDFIYRADAGFLKMYELIQNGAIGRPVHAKFFKMNEINKDSPFERSFIDNYLAHLVGPNFMSGGHYVFWLWMLCGLDGLSAIEGNGRKYDASYPFSNSDYNRLVFLDNFAAEIGITWLPVADEQTKEIYNVAVVMGEEGTLQYDSGKEKVYLYRQGKPKKEYCTPKRDRHRKMLELFVEKIQGKPIENFPTGLVGSEVLTVISKMNKAIQRNTV